MSIIKHVRPRDPRDAQKYALTVTPNGTQSRVVWIVGRAGTLAEARAALRRYVYDWRAGRVTAFGDAVRLAHGRKGFTAPAVQSGAAYDLKKDHSRTNCGRLEIVNARDSATATTPTLSALPTSTTADAAPADLNLEIRVYDGRDDAADYALRESATVDSFADAVRRVESSRAHYGAQGFRIVGKLTPAGASLIGDAQYFAGDSNGVVWTPAAGQSSIYKAPADVSPMHAAAYKATRDAIQARYGFKLTHVQLCAVYNWHGLGYPTCDRRTLYALRLREVCVIDADSRAALTHSGARFAQFVAETLDSFADLSAPAEVGDDAPADADADAVCVADFCGRAVPSGLHVEYWAHYFPARGVVKFGGDWRDVPDLPATREPSERDVYAHAGTHTGTSYDLDSLDAGRTPDAAA